MPKKIETKARVCVIESLDMLDEASHREGEMLSHVLRLANKKSGYIYVRSKRELEQAFIEFGASDYRYLHLSCHGSKKAFYTTLDKIPAEELAELLAPYVENRRVFISSCWAAHTKNVFAERLMELSKCRSVVAPVKDIYFNDAAIFWSAFYHVMFKDNRDAMKRVNIGCNIMKCARLIREQFKYVYRDSDGGVTSVILPRRSTEKKG